MRKKPFVHLQYESEEFDPKSFSEFGVDTGAKIDVSKIDDPDVFRFITETKDFSLRQKYTWLIHNLKNVAPSSFFVPLTISDDRRMEIVLRKHRNLKLVVLSRSLHNTFHVDRCLSLLNESMEPGAYLFLHSRTSALIKQMIISKYRFPLGHIIYFFHFLWHRVCSKLKATKHLYYDVTGGMNRSFSRVELLGRLYHAGFDVKHESYSNGEFFVVATKFRRPIYGDHPSQAPLIKLRRVGKDGKLINVYKFRTMHSYSEYLQPYIYKYQNLDEEGKFANDYRISNVGHFMRRVWIDELPMIINFFKGQMKLVGVRPLSRHYFSLYTPEMQALRTRTKPGLLPPFYYEGKVPQGLDEIQASERRYLEAYLKNPILTDWRYFWGIVRNILFGHRKSH